jgi:hypothetical protein
MYTPIFREIIGILFFLIAVSATNHLFLSNFCENWLQHPTEFQNIGKYEFGFVILPVKNENPALLLESVIYY